MKQLITLFALLPIAAAAQTFKVEVSNPSNTDRKDVPVRLRCSSSLCCHL